MSLQMPTTQSPNYRATPTQQDSWTTYSVQVILMPFMSTMMGRWETSLILFIAYMVFMALLRMFLLFWANKHWWMKTSTSKGKTTWLIVSRSWLSHNVHYRSQGLNIWARNVMFKSQCSYSLSHRASSLKWFSRSIKHIAKSEINCHWILPFWGMSPTVFLNFDFVSLQFLYGYRKNSKIWDTSNNCHNCPKNRKVWCNIALMHPKDADGIAKSVDPDQTASSEAVWSWSALFAGTYLSQYIEFVRYSSKCSNHGYFIMVPSLIEVQRSKFFPFREDWILEGIFVQGSKQEAQKGGKHGCTHPPLVHNVLKYWDT